MPSSGQPAHTHKRKLNGIFVICFLSQCFGHFSFVLLFNVYRSFTYLLLFSKFVLISFLCLKICLSASACVSFAFSLFFCLFVLCYSGLFLSNLVVFMILDASLNSNGKEKERKKGYFSWRLFSVLTGLTGPVSLMPAGSHNPYRIFNHSEANINMTAWPIT